MQPDIAFALSDTPFTAPPHSQKRMTKSIERSAAWLADLLRPVENAMDDSPAESIPNVFVHMAGGTSTSARRAFSYSLTETLHGLEANAVKPLSCQTSSSLNPQRQGRRHRNRRKLSDYRSHRT